MTRYWNMCSRNQHFKIFIRFIYLFALNVLGAIDVMLLFSYTFAFISISTDYQMNLIIIKIMQVMLEK